VRFGPLTTFYEAEAEDSEDREKLELAWQEPAPLAVELRKVAAAIASDPMCETLARRGDGLSIPAEAGALAALLDAPAATNTRVRLVYAL
jgi:hypothetical protein